MKLSEVKKHLETLNSLNFRLPDGKFVPTHFHVTEIGQVSKNFIDCGGTIRKENKISFQLWNADDVDHRLAAKKLKDIIVLAEKSLQLDDAEVEVEYQGTTIGKYGLEFDGKNFNLVNQFTTCLAPNSCGIPKTKKNLREYTSAQSCCEPGSTCC
jgi:hypothetical protein